MNHKRSLSIATMLATAAVATAQLPVPTQPFPRTFDLLVFDTTSTVGPPATSDNVFRLSDLNQDGDYYDAGETLLYYDDLANGDVLNTVTGMACSETGTTYACDSSSDIVLTLRDLNYDGDANDLNESKVFFDSATNLSGITMLSAAGIVVDALGRVFVLTANSGSTPSVVGDCIIKLEDLDGDGDANDLGEASYYFEVPGSAASLPVSLPTNFAVGPDGAFYYGDITTATTKGVYRAFDTDSSGVIDGTEYGLWWTPPSFAASPAWYGFAFDVTGQLLVANHGGGSTSMKSIHRVFDFNTSGAIDPGLPEEELAYTWNSGAGTFWSLLRRDDGAFLMLDGILDGIYQLKDQTSDGDFDDLGESVAVFDDTTLGLTLDLRAMAILRAPLLTMSPATIPIGGTTNFVIQTTKPFDLAVAAASLSLIAPFPLPPWGNLEIDPLSVIIFGTGLSDAAATFVSPLTFNNDPALIGSYGCTALCGDGYRLFLSNGAPLTVTAAPVPQLVINEVDYDQVSTDTDSYIEILNTGATPVSLAGLEVRMINGSNSTQYGAYSLSTAGASLAPGQYLVIANSTVVVAPGALVITATGDFIQNGAPDGIALFDTNSNQMIDALSYEGSITAAVLTGIPGTWNLAFGTPFAGADINGTATSLARLPNGVDTGDDSVDWALTVNLTPGAANF